GLGLRQQLLVVGELAHQAGNYRGVVARRGADVQHRVQLLRDVPAVALALDHEAFVGQPLAADVVDGARAVEVVARLQLLHDAQRGDQRLARVLVVGAGVEQRLPGALRGGAVEVGTHELVVVFLAFAVAQRRLGARQQLADAGRQRLRGSGTRRGAGPGWRRLRLDAAFDEVVELRFDFRRHDGAPLRAVLQESDHDGDLDRAAVLGLDALAHQVDHLAVRHRGQPLDLLVFARTQPQALGQRGVELLRGRAFQRCQ